MSATREASTPDQPSTGDRISLQYRTTQGGGTERLSGEVVDTTPTPNGWKAKVDSFEGGRRKVTVEGATATVETRKNGGDGTHARIGFADVSDWQP